MSKYLIMNIIYILSTYRKIITVIKNITVLQRNYSILKIIKKNCTPTENCRLRFFSVINYLLLFLLPSNKEK